MIRVEESVEINRPVEEVFSYASNLQNFPEWVGSVIEVRQDAPGGGGPLRREGARFTAMKRALGRRFEGSFEVIDYEPNRRYAHRSTEGHSVPQGNEPLGAAHRRQLKEIFAALREGREPPITNAWISAISPARSSFPRLAGLGTVAQGVCSFGTLTTV